MNQIYNAIVIFDNFIKSFLKKHERIEVNSSPVNTIDFLIDVLKGNESPFLANLIKSAGMSNDDFLKHLEKFNKGYTEVFFPTIFQYEHTEVVRSYRAYSGKLLNYLYGAMVTAKQEGRQLVYSDQVVREIFKNPPLDFIDYLEDECNLTVKQIRRNFYEN